MILHKAVPPENDIGVIVMRKRNEFDVTFGIGSDDPPTVIAAEAAFGALRCDGRPASLGRVFRCGRIRFGIEKLGIENFGIAEIDGRLAALVAGGRSGRKVAYGMASHRYQDRQHRGKILHTMSIDAAALRNKPDILHLIRAGPIVFSAQRKRHYEIDQSWSRRHEPDATRLERQ